MEYYHDGYLRIFERLRSNSKCDDSNDLCEIMAKIPKPGIFKNFLQGFFQFVYLEI